MSTQALKNSSSFTRLSLVAAALFGVLSPSVQAETLLSGYVGGTFGVAPSQRVCDQAPTCTRVGTAGKLFGGWNMTPNVAAEINYFYFGALDKSYDGTQTAPLGVASVKETSRVVTVGINWSIELFQVFTNHIRLGAAQSQLNKVTTMASGAVQHERTYTMVPYLGLGISLPINSTLRFQSGYDYIIDGDASHHLFSAGFSAEF